MVVDEFDAYFVDLVAPCLSVPEQRWSVRPISSQEGYQLRNAAVSFNLDVLYSAVAPETPAILYGPHVGPNQRFLFRVREDGAMEIAPVHAPTQCLTTTADGVQIWPCSAADERQTWELLPESCA